MNIYIEVATENNLANLLPLVSAYHNFENIQTSKHEREKSIRHLVTNESLGKIWLIYEDTKIIGYIALCFGFSIEFSGLDAFVDEFFIAPDLRGRGVGTKVLECVKIEAKKMGIRALHLEVARSNKKARNLYTRSNFKAREKYVLMSVNLHPDSIES